MSKQVVDKKQKTGKRPTANKRLVANKKVAAGVMGLGVFVLIFLLLVVVRPKFIFRIPYLSKIFLYAETELRGPRLPVGSRYGIDISRHQGEIDWSKVKIRYDLMSRRMTRDGSVECNVDFVIAKATEGITIVDNMYSKNRAGAKSIGAKFGAFHYFSYTTSPKAQAAYFVKNASLRKGDLAPVLDIEDDGNLQRMLKKGGLDKSGVRTRALTWLKEVEKACGCKPVIYTSASFKEEYLDGADFERYPLWVAHYQVDTPRVQGMIWQFTEQGVVTGVKGSVDVDVFGGSESEFDDLLIR